MKISKILIILILFAINPLTTNAQFFSRFSLAGGPVAGWQITNVKDINSELSKIGIPAFPDKGYFTLGGSGFIDVPGSSWLRIGGIGIGFSAERNAIINNLTKTVKYDYGMGGLSVEYVKPLSSSFDITGGIVLGTGTLKLNLYQNNASFGNWNEIFGEIGSGSSSQNISRELTQRFYSVQPRVGLGFFLTQFLYGKLNVGYLFTANSGWRADNNIKVTNFPEGIKADGLDVNLGFNFGLFFK